MIEKVRSAFFETNSSSMDRYDDYDDNYPRTVRVTQTVHIELLWKDDVPDERVDEILDQILEDKKFEDQLYSIFADYYEHPDSLFIDNVDDGDITFDFEDCTVDLSWNGKYYPATRYEPAEYPEPEIDDHDGVPEKNQENKAKEKDIQAIMKIFQERGWTEIIGIKNFYSDEIDMDDVDRALD